jgi:hypothetical protein
MLASRACWDTVANKRTTNDKHFRPAIKHSHPCFAAVCRYEQMECLVQLQHLAAANLRCCAAGSAPLPSPSSLEEMGRLCPPPVERPVLSVAFYGMG